MMKDYFEAAMYTALFIAGVAGIATFISAFPLASLYGVGLVVLGLMYYSILSAIRSQRTINEIRRRYE